MDLVECNKTANPMRAVDAVHPTRNHALSIVRWVLPAIYAVCAFCFLLNAADDLRRVALAKKIADIIRTENPATLDALTVCLGGHIDEVRRVSAAPNRPEDNGAHILLSPSVILRLWVQLTPETNRIENIRLIYFGSEDISLDAPTEKLPVPGWEDAVFFLFITFVPCILWRYARPKPGRAAIVSWMVAFLAIAPLVLAIPLAFACIVRVAL